MSDTSNDELETSAEGVEAQRKDSAPSPFSDGKITKSEANYRRNNESNDRRGGNCDNFQEPDKCSVVAGKIRSRDVCDRWEPEQEDVGVEQELLSELLGGAAPSEDQNG